MNLSASAPAGGTVVNLQSSNTSVVTVPASVTVAPGISAVVFSVTVQGIGAAMLTAQLATPNSQFVPVTAPFGWNVTLLSGPGVYYGDSGAT